VLHAAKAANALARLHIHPIFVPVALFKVRSGIVLSFIVKKRLCSSHDSVKEKYGNGDRLALLSSPQEFLRTTSEQSHPPPMPHSENRDAHSFLSCAMPHMNTGALRSERAVSGRGGGSVFASTCGEHGKHAWNLPLQTPSPSHRTR
jgi:hypothetical protein